MTDYHTKPLLTCRVPRESLDWARSEAERRGQPFGDFMDGLITVERERVVSPVFIAADDQQPGPARKNCKHRNMRGVKGVCPDCKEWVSPAASRTNGGQ